MPEHDMAVAISAGDGHDGGTGTISVAQLPLRTRLGRAGVTFLLGGAIGTALLPVPLIHLFGVMFFLGMTYLAVNRLVTHTVVLTAHGRCPSCGAEEKYYVGMGGRRLRFPISTSCPKCHVTLDLDAARATQGS